MICMKKVRLSSRPRAKVRCQGPLGSARAQPCVTDCYFFCHLSSVDKTRLFEKLLLDSYLSFTVHELVVIGCCFFALNLVEAKVYP